MQTAAVSRRRSLLEEWRAGNFVTADLNDPAKEDSVRVTSPTQTATP
ncbi:MAG: hypothetical protein R3F11_26950 [Verrucomicrobiales bacterium]